MYKLLYLICVLLKNNFVKIPVLAKYGIENFLPVATAVRGHLMMDDMNVMSCGDNDGY